MEVNKKILLVVRGLLYLRRESNPHSEEHEFESCASTNSATQASSVMNSSAKVQLFFESAKKE